MAIGAALPRLPFGQNHLGISENTTVALLCCVTELCSESPENARYDNCDNRVTLSVHNCIVTCMCVHVHSFLYNHFSVEFSWKRVEFLSL